MVLGIRGSKLPLIGLCLAASGCTGGSGGGAPTAGPTAAPSAPAPVTASAPAPASPPVTASASAPARPVPRPTPQRLPRATVTAAFCELPPAIGEVRSIAASGDRLFVLSGGRAIHGLRA